MDGPAPGDVWAFNDTAGQPLSSSYATDWGSSDEHTTHFCVVDKDRTIVSMTQSIIGSFGSKVVVPGTGFLFNNSLKLFNPKPDALRSLAPGKRTAPALFWLEVFCPG